MQRWRLALRLCFFMSVLACFAPKISYPTVAAQDFLKRPSEPATAMFAGGCFWSMESAFEHLQGVVEVESGYAGGSSKNPTYENYAKKGHREVVLVHYDPSKITYAGLVEYFLKHINPLDRTGSFVDRGANYAPSIYFSSDEEKKEAYRVIQAIDQMKVFRKKISLPVVSQPMFWPAEAYHQDYHRLHETEYQAYRRTSGRDEFLTKQWGDNVDQLVIPGSIPVESENQSTTGTQKAGNGSDQAERNLKPWEKFKKPSSETLRKRLSRLEFSVTQNNHTEPPFQNKFFNHHEDGIYVDIVSGEPLFASSDKFDSGTGWPSFTQPLEKEAVTYHQDATEAELRTEVRSSIADSHLGHVFQDGPRDRGGYRFCINSASLRFIPVAQLEKQGYGEYLSLFSKK